MNKYLLCGFAICALAVNMSVGSRPAYADPVESCTMDNVGETVQIITYLDSQHASYQIETFYCDGSSWIRMPTMICDPFCNDPNP